MQIRIKKKTYKCPSIKRIKFTLIKAISIELFINPPKCSPISKTLLSSYCIHNLSIIIIIKISAPSNNFVFSIKGVLLILRARLSNMSIGLTLFLYRQIRRIISILDKIVVQEG